MKQECKNCVKWSKCSGTKKDKNERGVCKFLNSCIYYTWEQEEPERDKNNKSLIINDGSVIDGKIGHLRISSTSKELIHRHVYIWTDAGFCCSNYEPKTA
jgi:hypothetical protein